MSKQRGQVVVKGRTLGEEERLKAILGGVRVAFGYCLLGSLVTLIFISRFDENKGGLLGSVPDWLTGWFVLPVRSFLPNLASITIWYVLLGGMLAFGFAGMIIAQPLKKLMKLKYGKAKKNPYLIFACVVVAIIFINPAEWIKGDHIVMPYIFDLNALTWAPFLIAIAQAADSMEFGAGGGRRRRSTTR